MFQFFMFLFLKWHMLVVLIEVLSIKKTGWIWHWGACTSCQCCPMWLYRYYPITNKSTQRVYNAFEKGQTHPPSPSLSPPPLLLAQLFPFHLEKRENFAMSYRFLHWNSTPFQFTPYPLSLPLFHLPSPFHPFPMCYHNLVGIFDSELMSSVPYKSRQQCNEWLNQL